MLGLRADFYGHCAAYPELVAALGQGQVLLGAMDAAELRQAIENPARAVDMEVQPGLVEVMLADLGAGEPAVAPGIGYRPGALPLLSHALLATWQQRDGRTLTVDGYRLGGGIHGAIAHTAERAYRQLDPAGQQTARRLLLRMIMLGDGTDDTRRPADRAQLVAEVADPAMVEAVLEVLARARLVTLDATTVDIAHEALLRAWPRLRDWIDTDRAGLLVRQRLVDAAESWDREGRHLSALYRGPRLAAARDWVDGHDPDLSPLTRAFLSASVEHERAELRATRLRTRKVRRLATGLTALLILAAAATGYAVQARNDSVREHLVAVSRQVAGEAVALRVANPELAAQLSLAAYQRSPTAEARGALISTTVSLDRTRVYGATTGDAVRAVVFNPVGDVAAAASQDGAAYLWQVSHPAGFGGLLARIEHGSQVRSVVFRPGDGHVLATASRDTTAGLWDVRDPRRPIRLATLAGHRGAVFDVAFSPDGRTLATAGEDTTARLWDVHDPRTPAELATLTGHSNDITSVAFSPTGRTVATGSIDGTTLLWDVTNLRAPTRLAVLAPRTGFVNSLAFSPDGRLLATANHDMTARLWDVSTPGRPKELSVLAGHTGPVFGVAFSPDGRTAATGGLDTATRLWDVSDPAQPVALAAPIVGHTNDVYGAAFSPDGRTLATAGHDLTVRLWDIDAGHAAADICRAARHPLTRTEWDRYFPGLDYSPPCP